MYEWVPCEGPSAEALARMRERFPKPTEPMGEAWFLGAERERFTRLADEPLAEIDADYLLTCLFEITSGTSSFGRREEWERWFRFLLPDLILRAHERHAFTFLLEETVNAFMVIFWDGLEGEYAGFTDDALQTLGRCLMKGEFWEGCGGEAGGPPLARFLRWEEGEGANRPAPWDAGDASAALSASLFFCLKYLPAGEVAAWAESVASVEDPYFRGALVVWLLGSLDLLSEESPRAARIEKTNPRVRWHSSFLLGSSSENEHPTNERLRFLPRENCEAFVRAVRRRVTPEALVAWADSFSEDGVLSEVLLNAPELLFDKLLKGD